MRKVKSFQPRRSGASRCQLGAATYAPTQTEVPQTKTSDKSTIEQQLLAQHHQPAELLPLQRRESSLLLDNSIILLDEVARSTTVTPHAAGVVLGFSVANGAVASKDFLVGKVRNMHT